MRCPFCANDDSQVKDSRPTEDGASVGFAVTDRLRAEMLARTGLTELLHAKAKAKA